MHRKTWQGLFSVSTTGDAGKYFDNRQILPPYELKLFTTVLFSLTYIDKRSAFTRRSLSAGTNLNDADFREQRHADGDQDSVGVGRLEAELYLKDLAGRMLDLHERPITHEPYGARRIQIVTAVADRRRSLNVEEATVRLAGGERLENADVVEVQFAKTSGKVLVRSKTFNGRN